jgi:hypothetical protein
LLKREQLFANANLLHQTVSVNHAPLIENLMMVNPKNRDAIDLRLPVRWRETKKRAVMRPFDQKTGHDPVILSDHVFDIDAKIAKSKPHRLNHRFETGDPIRQLRLEWQMIDEISIDKLIDQINPATIPALVDIPANHGCRGDSKHLVTPRRESNHN